MKTRGISRIAQLRLQRQRIVGAGFDSPGQVVSWLGAIQAQDYAASLWAIGLRMREATRAKVEQAIAERRIVRTWPMRGTLHFVAAEDARWMSALMTPRVIAASKARLLREFGLDDAVLARCRKVLVKALRDGQSLTRSDLYATLEKAGITTGKQRGIHITGRLAQEGLLCLGPRADKQPTFVLLEEWVAAHRDMERDQALAELARRYFFSHGPATTQDFAWWSGLTLKDVRLAIQLVGTDLEQETIGDRVYLHAGDAIATNEGLRAPQLLPAFDEYLVAYKDRSDALEARFSRQVIGVNGLFNAGLVIDGRIVGTWKRSLGPTGIVIELSPFRALLKKELKALDSVARRHGDFMGMPVRLRRAE
ncbi:winged helix DNA-binding domain-containing protein [Pseudoxanthomonas yeongjuensis]|uniref:winged helix DNA-binding domain-containing protein n=1 Tax=Pseudoxanthomonas yeongjuensis TaxID=377616 RepID=UPI0013918059|nr:winged helix DNA-binding domain-containing protein [Pseudoxanthomonas yeongjuensis]